MNSFPAWCAFQKCWITSNRRPDFAKHFSMSLTKVPSGRLQITFQHGPIKLLKASFWNGVNKQNSLHPFFQSLQIGLKLLVKNKFCPLLIQSQVPPCTLHMHISSGLLRVLHIMHTVGLAKNFTSVVSITQWFPPWPSFAADIFSKRLTLYALESSWTTRIQNSQNTHVAPGQWSRDSADKALACTANCHSFHPMLLSEAFWTPINVVSALQTVHNLSLHWSCSSAESQGARNIENTSFLLMFVQKVPWLDR